MHSCEQARWRKKSDDDWGCLHGLVGMSTIGMQANLGIKDDLRCGVLAGRAWVYMLVKEEELGSRRHGTCEGGEATRGPGERGKRRRKADRWTLYVYNLLSAQCP